MSTLVIEPPPSAPDDVTSPEPAAARKPWWVRPGRPAWSLPARAGVTVLAAVLYTWDLSRNGMGNTFYAAAVKSGTESWKAFLFGSLDPGNFITVDKPPASLWVMELSARLFGFSSRSILLPEALAGVATVLVLYRLVRRWAGEPAALLASVAMALTPIAVVMFRFDNPDALLVLLLVLAAWALWSALETARTWKLVVCGGLLGLAFTTKMLQAFIVLPVFGLVYLWAGPPRIGRRVVQLLWAGLALAVSSGWWVALVELWPAGSRPYVGGSSDNSELNLIFGYNGFGRLFGSSGPGGGGGGAGFGSTAGVLRMFDELVGGQISWLLPLALVGLVAGLWVTRRGRRTDRVRAGYVLWGGWALCTAAVFSETQGVFHPYYTVALAPAVAALAGAGAVVMWRIGRVDRRWCWLLPVAVAGSGVWAAVLLDRTPGYDPWLAPSVVAGSLLAAAGIAAALTGRTSWAWLPPAAVALAAVSLLAGPAAYSVTSIREGTQGGGNLVVAGPSTTAGPGRTGGPGGGSAGRFGPVTAGVPPAPPAGGPAGGPAGLAEVGRLPTGARRSGLPAARGAGTFGGTGAGTPGRAGTALPTRGGRAAGPGGATADPALVRFLEAHRDGAEYLLAVEGSQTAAPYILATGDPVMAMGGFTGSDPWPTLSALEHLVREGKVHYVLSGGGAPGGPGPAGSASRSGSRDSAVSAVERWVEQHGTVVPSRDYGGGAGASTGGTLYEVGASSSAGG